MCASTDYMVLFCRKRHLERILYPGTSITHSWLHMLLRQWRRLALLCPLLHISHVEDITDISWTILLRFIFSKDILKCFLNSFPCHFTNKYLQKAKWCTEFPSELLIRLQLQLTILKEVINKIASILYVMASFGVFFQWEKCKSVSLCETDVAVTVFRLKVD